MVVSDENTCTFYASEYHLEMILLPYINKNLNQNKKVCIFTQNNLEDTIKTLVKNINLKEEDKNKILNIDWKCTDEKKYKEIEKNENEFIVFVKGNKEYIEKTNKNLSEIKNNNIINIIDCYSIDDVKSKDETIKKYKNILVTSGIQKL